MSSTEITIKTLDNLFKKNENFILLDVREKNELIYGVIHSSKNIPLSEFEKALSITETSFKKKYGFNRFNKSDKIIVYCRSGHKSSFVVSKLNDLGFNALNLQGGINEWAKIDKTIKIY